MDERTFIDWLKKRSGPIPGEESPVRTGIGDDMAVLELAGQTLLLGSDMIVQGVHFDWDRASPEQVGRKALAVCLSDCAAMACEPTAAVVSFAKPDDLGPEVLKRVYHGLFSTAERFGCSIVGGDSCGGSDRLVIDVAVLGAANGVGPVLRSGGRAGDYLYVTGKLGGSILGSHLDFTPRVSEARWLAVNLSVHAMIDLSDGLSTDVGHICRASGCGAELVEDLLEKVISDAARRLSATSGRDPLDHALNDGEDFELLAAIDLSPDELPQMPEGLALFHVGKIVGGTSVTLIDSTGRSRALPSGGYAHF